MRLKPNLSRLQARVLGLRRCEDGFGAEVDLEVLRCGPLEPGEDFIGAQAGSQIQAFTAVPESIEQGVVYAFEATVLGGPQGERIVLQKTLLGDAPAQAPASPPALPPRAASRQR